MARGYTADAITERDMVEQARILEEEGTSGISLLVVSDFI